MAGNQEDLLPGQRHFCPYFRRFLSSWRFLLEGWGLVETCAEDWLSIVHICHGVLTCMCAKLLQSCPTLCDTMDHNPSDSSVHGILQARILEWVTMPSSRGSFQPRDQTHISYIYLPQQVGSLPLAPPGKPLSNDIYFQLITHLWFRHLLILI